MKAITFAVGLVIFASACNYSHVGAPTTTFNRAPSPLGAATNETQNTPLVLTITRHLDTVLNGPDPDEDQVLVLTVQNFRTGQKLKIPSDKVTPEFTANRFGPSSKGDFFVGYIIVKKVTAHAVEVSLHLDVTAHTPAGSYTEKAKFHGNYSFAYLAPENEPAP